MATVTRLVNFRVTDVLRASMTEAASSAGFSSVSSWMRAALEAEANRELDHRTVVHVEVDEDLLAFIVRAARVADMPLSEWMREALEAGARQEIAGHQRQASQRLTTAALNGTATRRLGMSVGHAGCSHPLPAREQTVEAEVCGMCGAVTRWKV